MYIIVMDDEKQLTPTIKQPIYRGENLVNDIKFLLPLTYKEFDLSEFTVTLQYVHRGLIVCEEVLLMDSPSLRPDRLSYSLRLDSVFTKREGRIEIQLRITKVNTETAEQYILKTSSCFIDILPAKRYYVTKDEEGELSTKLEEMNSKIEIFNSILATKADDIVLDSENEELYLSSSGYKIGKAISTKELGDVIADSSTDGLINVLI